MKISKSIHVTTNDIILFFLMAEYYSIVYMYHIVFLSIPLRLTSHKVFIYFSPLIQEPNKINRFHIQTRALMFTSSKDRGAFHSWPVHLSSYPVAGNKQMVL